MLMIWNRTFIGGMVGLVFASGAFAEPEKDVWSICAAGREISPGITVEDTTYGIVFTAWLQAANPNIECPSWYPIWQANSGSLVASVQRRGDAGFGSMVDLTGGVFQLKLDDGMKVKACVESGTVEWPASRDTYVDGCGNGVASVNAELSWGCTGEVSGGFEGCLDDQKWLVRTGYRFPPPPKIWGELWSEMDR